MTTRRLLTVQVALLIGLGAVFLLPSSTKSSPAGIAMTLPNIVGAWIGDDAEVTAREIEVLAKDTQFARKIYTGPKGDQIFVSIVMSGDDMTNSIHRPERCLPAQGWSLQESEKRTVALRSGKSLELTRLRTFRSVPLKDQTQQPLYNLNYYWFVGSDEMTSSHLSRTGIDLRDRILRGYNQKWAYITVTAIVTEHWARPGHNEAQTTAVVEEFIRDLVPKLSRPDGGTLL